MRIPQPKYGWHGQEQSVDVQVDAFDRFAVGTRVYITGGQPHSAFGGSPAQGEVIPLGTPPSSISQKTDLVHLRITDGGTFRLPVGYEDWWSEWQLEVKP